MAAATALGVLLGGCRTPHAEVAKEKDPIPAQVVNLSAGNSTQYGPVPKREAQWHVEWQMGASASLTPKGELSQGTMQGVKGYVFDHGKPSSTFESVKGWGGKNRQELILAGNVHVRSQNPKAELDCDRLVYDANAKVFRASGHVQVVGNVGTIGTLSQLWATHDLKVVATPDMFTPR